MRIKAKEKDGVVEVKAMAQHPMLSGIEAKKLKKDVNYITHMVAEVNGKVVYEVNMSQFLSKDPYVKFYYKGAKGDKIVMTWVDLSGKKVVSDGKAK
jgi:sulfur-oxidizing protein SoxZ